VPVVLAIPVVTAVALSGDVPVYLTGLGTVKAYNTVTIHVRVNGALDKVVFVEGQDVKAGDLLAQIDFAAVQLLYTTITSPISGRTGVRLIDAGNIVQSTDTTGLVVVTQIEPISVLFTLPEDDFEVVNKQMAAGTLTVAASSRADNKMLGQGTLLLINNQIDQTTGTIQLKATFPNQDHALWPGPFVDVRLLVETRHNAVTVPSAAVQLGPKGVYAYVVGAGDKVQVVSVKLSPANGGGPVAVIEAGLSAGDRVVIDGQLKLRPGVVVKATEPQLADVTSDQQANAASATVTIERDRAARFGIQPALIDSTIYDAIGQREVTQFFTQLNSYHVVLEVDPALQTDPRLFDKLYLTSATTGQQVPLSYFVRVDMTKTGYLVINHQSQFPSVTVSFNLAGGASLGDAVRAVQQAEAQLGVPATLTGSFQGTAQAFQASLATTPYLIAAALLVVYPILGVLYESFIHPLTILSTLPSAGAGALLMLLLFGYELSVIAIIGIIMLIGIVKKNGIMMMDFALSAQRERHLPPEEAIYQACAPRFRPIMMTTMCAILGGLPRMLAGGTGSEPRQPLGFAMVGGLLLSQMLTLFTTPVVCLYLDRLSRWRRAGEAGVVRVKT
jgi:multidrug efflux pump subunit AcrA (membrane-fusion protein)